MRRRSCVWELYDPHTSCPLTERSEPKNHIFIYAFRSSHEKTVILGFSAHRRNRRNPRFFGFADEHEFSVFRLTDECSFLGFSSMLFYRLYHLLPNIRHVPLRNFLQYLPIFPCVQLMILQ